LRTKKNLFSFCQFIVVVVVPQIMPIEMATVGYLTKWKKILAYKMWCKKSHSYGSLPWWLRRKKELKKNEVDRTQSRNENRGRSMRLRKKIVPSSPIIRKTFHHRHKGYEKKTEYHKENWKGGRDGWCKYDEWMVKKLGRNWSIM